MKKYYLLLGIFVLLDQLTKKIFENVNFELLSFFKLISVENTGAAFGIFQNGTWILAFISLIVVVIGFIYFKYYPLALSFLIAGALGNFIDRIFLGYVRDFISISIWPVFNFADIFSTIGVGLLIIKLYKEDKAYKLKSHRRK
ncbi:signal peptidase II [archaeon]|jgi:signal peptidase II|nr:signal peptidase II [archaeon]MBT3731204.1 signal peptidase II [archaeon]MBT4670042.1 signal peptidase II [archaeon]MBT5287755.1 signal peptidase II [archaeon]MBT7281689.1 signal peptidase II [archaeon]